jgi:glycerol-3-phosphate dehydrogenase (NAD(P)+)
VNKITFLGCGSWGGALGLALANKGMDVTMWHRNPEIVQKLSNTRKHYLVPSLIFPKSVTFTSSIDDAVLDASIVIIAVPSPAIRDLLKSHKDVFLNNQIIVNVSKGIEIDTLMTVSEVIADVLGNAYTKIVTLSGPSHAEEVIQGHPTTLVSSSLDIEAAQVIQNIFSNETLRIYTNTDIKGVELGGSIKNVIAIATGICDGIGYGDNTKAALLTRGMAEISRLGIAMGSKMKTFQGLSGMGDLIVTCLSKHSRNRLVGQSIGEGKSLNQILSEMKMVAEGVKTAKSVHQLRQEYNVNMPICEAVYQILFEKRNAKQSVKDLMTRELRIED